MPALSLDYLTRVVLTLVMSWLVWLGAKGLWSRSPHLGRGLIDDVYALLLALLALGVLIAGVSAC
jgi:hypothetical protein